MESTGRIEQGYDRLVQEYTLLEEKYDTSSRQVSRKIIQSGWIRVLCFFLLFALPIYLYDYSVVAAIVLFIAAVFCFVLLIKQFNFYKKRRAEFLELKTLNQNEISAQKGTWDCFSNGEKFIDPLHNYSHDLDLFGTGSFFQYINRTTTIVGERKLAEKLSFISSDIESIRLVQSVMKELSQLTEFRQLFYAKGRALKEKEEYISKIDQLKDYRPWLLKKSYLFKCVIKVLPILFVTSLLFTFFGFAPVVPVVIFLFNLTFVGSAFRKINKVNLQFSSLSSILQNYAVLTNLIVSQEFKSTGLKQFKAELYEGKANAAVAIDKLGTYMNHFDQRNGLLGGVILNGMLLWDYMYVLKIEKWLNDHKQHLFNWLNVVHEIDACNSLAGYVHNHPDFVFPELSEVSVFDVENLGHPLIDRKERVCNDFNYNESIFTLITGANMSGKSTFLRSVGLNLVLGNCGVVVCASKMKYMPMELVTNMRTTDSLMKHESYFFAELKRLKYIIDKLKEGNQVFIILDEILKGTNSKDKTYGSMELIRNLLNHHAYGMIATHDLELEILEKESSSKIVNYCFEVKNQSGQLLFDYKLYKGVTQNHNASFLMKKMGIIPIE
ncbi:MutS-related protein [Plebeiibacterium sediminum]|uniref:DNA mismatch repair proteins mutS family domain-containing protein n=1 Tax=Plebeiibacterium sediminum TaxID=2992112 RepID=A0AAE3M0I4_9BACT|nr:hypothetical protein [Plebeiobacterium sediminum]MCW3784841.1 hypothetical protein [Plebeiobacterium sediminum]